MEKPPDLAIKDLIAEALEFCTDIDLLDLVYKLLMTEAAHV